MTRCCRASRAADARWARRSASGCWGWRPRWSGAFLSPARRSHGYLFAFAYWLTLVSGRAGAAGRLPRRRGRAGRWCCAARWRSWRRCCPLFILLFVPVALACAHLLPLGGAVAGAGRARAAPARAQAAVPQRAASSWCARSLYFGGVVRGGAAALPLVRAPGRRARETSARCGSPRGSGGWRRARCRWWCCACPSRRWTGSCRWSRCGSPPSTRSTWGAARWWAALAVVGSWRRWRAGRAGSSAR